MGRDMNPEATVTQRFAGPGSPLRFGRGDPGEGVRARSESQLEGDWIARPLFHMSGPALLGRHWAGHTAITLILPNMALEGPKTLVDRDQLNDRRPGVDEILE